jgi:uncharacterized delta-60 repeat protein
LAAVLALLLFAAQADQVFGGAEELCGLAPVGGIAAQPDGKIVVCTIHGRCLVFVNERTGVFGRMQGGVFRFESDGSVDHSFRSELKVEPGRSYFDWSLSLQPDGKLLARGQKDRIARLASDGRLDQTFPLQPAQTNAPPVWADFFVLRPCALGPAGEIVGRGVCSDWGGGVNNGWDSGSGPIPVIHWFDSTGRFLHSSSWTEHAPDLAAHLTSVGIRIRRAHWFVPYGRKEKDVSYRPLEAPLEEQLADPGLAALLRRVADELPLSLCRYALRLPDGGVVLAFCEDKNPRAGRLARFNREWQWDRGFLARFELGHPANTVQLAWDERGGLLVIGALATLNGREFTGLARLLADGATDPAFRVSVTSDMRNSPIGHSPAAIAVQQDGRILLGGCLIAINGIPCSSLVRLNPDGSVDREFLARFSNAPFEEVKRRLAISRPNLAARPNAAAASAPGGATPVLQFQAEPAGASQTVWVHEPELVSDIVIVDYDGSPGESYVLQASDALNTPTWSNIGTNQTNGEGHGRFKDENADTAPIRFYRVLSLH